MDKLNQSVGMSRAKSWLVAAAILIGLTFLGGCIQDNHRRDHDNDHDRGHNRGHDNRGHNDRDRH